MKINITHISDTHNRHRYLKLIGGDILICSGDISSVGYKHEIKSFLSWFSKQPYIYKIFISGNHDLCFDPNRQGIDNSIWINKLFDKYEINKDKQIYYLNNSSLQLFGCLNIWGSPITPDFNPKRWAFNKTRGENIQKTWDLIPENLDILITHGPPRGKCDMNREGEYVGCENLRDEILLKRPRIHCFGHIHESYGQTYDSFNVDYINACICDLHYNPINNPINFIYETDSKIIEYI